MTSKKTTRRALFSSVIALILCCSMLVGTTFAWFTDSVTSIDNVITAGNLDIELYHKNVDQDEADYVRVGSDNIFENVLWEPGHVEVVNLKIENKGTLALKYQFHVGVYSETPSINQAGDPFKLSDFIKFAIIDGAFDGSREEAVAQAEPLAVDVSALNWSIPGGMARGETKEVSLVVWMPESVDNKANYMTGAPIPSVTLSLNLFATQKEAESDSFGTDYDKDAVWTGVADKSWYNNTDTEFTLTSAEDLAGLADIVNSGTDSFNGKTVKLGADIDLNNVNWTPIGVSGKPFDGTFIGTGYTIHNLRAIGTSSVGLFGRTWTGAHIEGVTVVNAYVSGNDYVGVIVGGGYLSRNCIKNCTVDNATVIATPFVKDGVYDGGAKAGVIVGQAYNGHLIGNTVTNSTVTAYRDLGGIAGMLDFDGGSGVTMVASGNTVKNVTLNYIGVAGKYDGNKTNGNMAAVVGRVGAKAEVADDNTVSEVTMNDDTQGAAMIFTLDELIAFAKEVNAGNTYSGKTVILGADIDLMNMEWTPIGTGDGFKGIFDGNGKTISNLKITGNNNKVGFFANTYDGEIKNLTIHNALVSGRSNVAVVTGNPYTAKYTNVTVSGHVEVNGKFYVGAVGGKNAYANWTDITVDVDDTSYVKADSIEDGVAYRTYVGGVIGFNGEGSHTFKNITTNIDVIGNVCDIGGAFGIAHYDNQFENVTVTGNVSCTGEADELGGIAGVWHNATGHEVSFTDCSFSGTVSDVNGAVSGCDFVGGAYSSSGTGKLIIVNYKDVNGVTYAVDGITGEQTLYLVPADYEGTTVNVAEGTTTIGGYAFAYNSNIETIVLSSTVKTLNDRAFRDTSASTVVLNEGLENISYQAFRNATNVTTVVIPSTVKTISKEAFQNSGITTLTIPANVETLEYGACRDMKELVSVVIEGDVDIPVYAFRACTKLETVEIKGNNVTFGGGSKGMIFTNKENGDGTAITVTVANEEIKARLLAADTAAKDYGGYTIVCKQTAEEGGYYLDEQGTAITYDDEGLVAALEDEKDVILMDDVKIEPAGMSNAYGTTGINVKNGQTIDGNGNTLDIKGAGGTWDSGINTTGGLIKNITVTGSFRGIFINHNSANCSKVILENVIIDGTVYTISCDQGSGNGLEATGCTFNGWTSYAATLGNAKFVDCSFGEGSGYAYCRPYAPTEFVGCDFEAGFEMDARAAVTFENCTIGGEPLTAENLATLVTGNTANASVK